MAPRVVPALFLCGAILASCSGTQAAEPFGAACEQFQANPTVAQSGTIKAGSDVTIILCSNPSTGFAWEEPQIGDTTVVRLADRTFQAPDATELPIVGRAGAEVLTVHAVAAGTTTISIAYSQAWEGGMKGEWTYQLSITVR